MLWVVLYDETSFVLVATVLNLPANIGSKA